MNEAIIIVIIIIIIICNYRLAATLYTVEKWFVSGI